MTNTPIYSALEAYKIKYYFKEDSGRAFDEAVIVSESSLIKDIIKNKDQDANS